MMSSALKQQFHLQLLLVLCSLRAPVLGPALPASQEGGIPPIAPPLQPKKIANGILNQVAAV
jgi:hypothetical protein